MEVEARSQEDRYPTPEEECLKNHKKKFNPILKDLSPDNSQLIKETQTTDFFSFAEKRKAANSNSVYLSH